MERARTITPVGRAAAERDDLDVRLPADLDVVRHEAGE
jgi:hypothetical protein